MSEVKIKKVIHIADLHIPNKCESRPYNKMLLENFIPKVKECVNNMSKDEFRIILVGDTFCDKIKSSNEARTMFHETLNHLNAIGKTLIIAGNHDMLENNNDRMDSLNPTFEISGAYNNVRYLDKELGFKSGCIVDNNIIWALYSMHDNFTRPNIDAFKEKYPENKIVGLFHGQIEGAKQDSGYIFENGIDYNVFSECDCVMMGHIHKFQEINKNNIPMVYSSSVFQQDFGENVSNHGFVVWNMETMKYKFMNVDNNYRMLKFHINSYDDIKNNKEKLLNE